MGVHVLVSKYDDNYKSVTDENNIIISEIVNMKKSELLDIYDKAERVEKFRYGFTLFLDGKNYLVKTYKNKATRKHEEFKFWLSQL